MKTLPTGLATHVALGSTTLAWGLKITRQDTQVFAFTSEQKDNIIEGVLYRSAPGLNVTEIASSSGFAVDNLELTTLDDGSVFTTGEVLSGLWRNAEFELFRYNSAAPADGRDIKTVGTVGNVELRRGSVVAELRGLQQYLQQPMGIVLSKTCRARLGDSLCTKDISAPPFRVGGSVSSVTNTAKFSDDSRFEEDDYFTNGYVIFTSGPCQGMSVAVNRYYYDGDLATYIFELVPTLFIMPEVGDIYTAVVGCRKRMVEDCAAKFDNVLNFQGEPHVPGIDAMTRPV